jgi:hypothetical protein
MLVDSVKQLCSKLSIPDESALDEIDVLLLPEKFDSAPVEDCRDTTDSIEFAKFLKSRGIACRSAFDFGLQPRVIDRRAADLWVGLIWILQEYANPLLVQCIFEWIRGKLGNDEDGEIHVDLRLGRKSTQITFKGSIENFEKVLSSLSGGPEKRE